MSFLSNFAKALVIFNVPHSSSAPGSSSDAVPLSANHTLTAEDDGMVWESTTAVTLTIPQDLSPKPQFIVTPKGGTVTVAVTGSATINGASTPLTRTLANNRAGFVVTPYLDANGYGVNGS